MNKRSVLHAVLCLFVVAPALSLRADEENKSIPDSSYEVGDEMGEEFEEQVAPETSVADILSSSQLSLKLRNYYLNRSKPQTLDSYAWAQGGILTHKIGRVGGYLSMTTELMGSFPLDAPSDHGGTLLVGKDGNSIVSFGVVNPRLTAQGQVLSVYRQRYSLPFVNDQDNRMLPNTFEGYTIGQSAETSERFQYIAGYINKMKKRDSEDFVPMSDAAGVSQVDRGMFLGGARVFVLPSWSIGAINYYVEDIFNTVYSESVYKFKPVESVENAFSVQYSNQSSNGKDLLRGESYSTGFWGVQNASSYQGLVFKCAYNRNERSADIRSPYGSYPGYNSVVVEDFNRAGEQSWQVGLSYDLAGVGLPGFKFATAFVQGNSAINESTGESLSDRNETDVTLDYQIAEGALKGLWVRLRSATIYDDQDGTIQDYRVIVNYDLNILNPAAHS
ncbi:MAG: OprD family outer membrane porin [Deltaproteobacteria bacterium]|nr:OprD family outer membrane porin [Deltaproteobacteria bacterium]